MKLVDISFSKYVHIDFMDGEFTQKKSVSLDDMKIIKSKDFIFGIHLMAYNPEKYIDKIKDLGIKRVYIHFEVYDDEKGLIKAINLFKDANLEVGLVLNPDTQPHDISNFIDVVDCVLIMSVWPGQEGQKFIFDSLEKVEELRSYSKNLEICMDGGIKENNFTKILDSGVNTFFVGSYISSCENPKLNYLNLINMFK